MAELRAYYYNKSDMLELVRYQKEESAKVVDAELFIAVAECGAKNGNKKTGQGGRYSSL